MVRAIGRRLGLSAPIAVALVLSLGYNTASAVFTRPFVKKLTGTAGGNFSRPTGITLDGHDNLWVSDPGVARKPPYALDEFGPGGEYKNSVPLQEGEPPTITVNGGQVDPGFTLPEQLAISDESSSFYLTGEQTELTYPPTVEIFGQSGGFMSRWEHRYGQPHITIDNSSSSPSAGSVYIAHATRDQAPPFGDGLASGIERFDQSGNPVSFTGVSPYIAGNQILGTPSHPFEGREPGSPGSVTTDAAGNIYVSNSGEVEGPIGEYKAAGAVDEYGPSGLFVRAFPGRSTPGVNGNYESGVGGTISGVVVDPVSHHVLYSVNSVPQNRSVIDEFDEKGNFIVQITEAVAGKPFEAGDLQLAVDSTGQLYVSSEKERAVYVYGPGHFLPSLKVNEASERRPESARLDGSVDPEGLTLSDCHFEYVPESTYQSTGFSDLSTGGQAQCAPGAVEIPADSSFHAVSVQISGLTSGVTYRYRLVAATSGALGGSTATSAPAFTAPGAPVIESTAVDNLSSSFADLHAKIDPAGAVTRYRFEYLTAAAFQENGESFTGQRPATVVPVVEGDLGSGGPNGDSPETVLQQVGGLLPGTSYRVRAVAANEIGTTDSQATSFATLPSVRPGLPDGRAYELVTPPDKESSSDMFAEAPVNREYPNDHNDVYVAETGGDLLLETRAAFGPFPASGENAYVFRRGGSGWSYASLASPALGVQSLAAMLLEPSTLSTVGIDGSSGSGAGAAGGQPLNLIGAPGGPYTTIHADARVGAGESDGEETLLVGSSKDLAHVVLQSKNHKLAHGAEHQGEGSDALYEWTAGGFKLVNVNAKGISVSACGAVLGAGTREGVVNLEGGAYSAVSSDGSKVFFTAPDPSMWAGFGGPGGTGCWNGATEDAPQVYARTASGTVEVSMPEQGVSDPTGQHRAVFVGASENGQRVFFLTESELTKNDEGIHDSELYEYDTVANRLTRVSAGESGKEAGNVYKVPAIAANGSSVYFQAFGRLTADAPAGLGSDEVNMYRYDTVAKTTTYVATVDSRDYQTGAAQVNLGPAPGLNYYTTPDGRFLLFASIRDLTGYDNAGPCYIPKDSFGGFAKRCSEVFRYDSRDRGLVCVSCNPTGAPALSDAEFARSATTLSTRGPIRAMSDDGSYVFFDTMDSLVPQDTNNALDTYEWHEGKVSLISSGQDPAPSFYLGMSPDGSNVFIGTHSRLAAQDVDSSGDVYDARIGGGFATGGGAGVCEGDACAGSSTAPIDATPASLTFSGAAGAVNETAGHETSKKRASTNAGRLKAALKACRKKTGVRRKRCEARARARYAKKSARPSAPAQGRNGGGVR